MNKFVFPQDVLDPKTNQYHREGGLTMKDIIFLICLARLQGQANTAQEMSDMVQAFDSLADLILTTRTS